MLASAALISATGAPPQGLQGLLAPQGLHGLQGLLFQAVARRGTTHFAETAPPLAPQGLQGLAPQGLHGFFAAHGLHGLQACFFAAQGLQGLQPFFFAAQGLHGLQPFFAAHGLQGLQPFFAAQGLHGLQPFFFAAHGLHAASCTGRGLAMGNRAGALAAPLDAPVAAYPGAEPAIAPPTANPATTNAGRTVVDKSFDFMDLTTQPPLKCDLWNCCLFFATPKGITVSDTGRCPEASLFTHLQLSVSTGTFMHSIIRYAVQTRGNVHDGDAPQHHRAVHRATDECPI